MNLLRVLLILLVIYLVLFMIRFATLSKIDRYSLINMIKFPFKNRCESPGFSIKLINFLKFPFKDKDYLSRISEGSIYTSYILDNPIYSKLDNKVYWSYFFKQHNVNHPKLVAYRMRGIDKVRVISKIEKDRFYIIKPIYGMLGTNVEKIKGDKVLKTLKNQDNRIVQELLKDCYATGEARHFRFVSFYNGAKFNIAELNSDKKVMSNHGQGGITVNCKNLNCNSLNSYQQKELNKMMEQLSKIHKEEFNMAFSIGWDIMLNCEKGDKIKAYCLEGNLIHSTWFYPENVDEKLRKDYIKEAEKFLKDRKYLD